MNKILLFFALLLPFTKGYSQVPGEIFKFCAPALNPLNPNGSIWSTNTDTTFTANESQEFELDWKELPTLIAEPNGDLQAGGNCLMTEIVENKVNGAGSAYAFFDDIDGLLDNGNDVIAFRIRCAKPWNTGAFGYSVLVDTDMRFGFTGADADTNAISGNPGYELEIRVKTGGAGAGVNVDDVDGTLIGTHLFTLPLSSNYQQSFALYNDSNCTGSPVFHDFFIQMDSLGLTSSTQFRVQPATSQSGLSVLGGSAADFNGVDDDLYNNVDSLMVAVTTNQPPVTGIDLGSGGNGFPVEMVSFTANARTGGVHLEWVTASEQNNDFFTIQRSPNARDVSTVTTVNGGGTTTDFRFYETYDRKPYAGRSFYRIQQTDFDGSTTFSKWVEVFSDNLGKLAVAVHPNPSNGAFTFSVRNAGAGDLNVQVLDMQGKIVYKSDQESATSVFEKDLNLSFLGKGIYLLRVVNGIRTDASKIIIR